MFGHALQGACGVVGRATWRFVVEVPEDDDFVVFWRVDALVVLHHVDFDRGRGGGTGSDDVGSVLLAS